MQIYINHYIWDFHEFFGLEEEVYIFPFEKELFEVKEGLSYIIIFIPKYKVDNNFSDLNFILKFSFKSFDVDAYQEINKVKYDDYKNKEIIGSFFMNDERGILIIISYIIPENPPTENKLLNLNLYTSELISMNANNKLFINFNGYLVTNDEYKYFKSIYLQ